MNERSEIGMSKHNAIGLVISRQQGGRIILQIPPGDRPRVVAIRASDIRGDTVRIGVNAPKDVRIDREERLVHELGETKWKTLLAANAGAAMERATALTG
jgi:sRNA-binding carbon storage regulator CsrA